MLQNTSEIPSVVFLFAGAHLGYQEEVVWRSGIGGGPLKRVKNGSKWPQTMKITLRMVIFLMQALTSLQNFWPYCKTDYLERTFKTTLVHPAPARINTVLLVRP